MIDETIDFHRNAMARMPSVDDSHPGVAFYVEGRPSQKFCTCQQSGKRKSRKNRTCDHLKALFKAVEKNSSGKSGLDLETRFKASVWHELATVLSRGDDLTPASVTTRFVEKDGRTRADVTTSGGNRVVAYLSTEGDRNRFADRLGAFSRDADEPVPDRAEILGRLALLTMTEAERHLHDLKMKSRRQALEESVWFRLAYHCFMAFGENGCRFQPSVDETTGAFIVTCKNAEEEVVFHASIARNRVRPLLECFSQHLPNQHDLPIHPIPLKSVFRVSRNTETDLDVYPVIQVLQSEGEERFFSREKLERFIYGDLVYIPELKILAELEKPGSNRKFVAPKRMTFKRYQIPNFLESAGDELEEGGFVIDPDVKGLQLLKRWHSTTLTSSTIDRDWCWLSIAYGFGDESVSLNRILKARADGNRYIGTPAGWVDTQSPEMVALAELAEALPEDRFDAKGEAVRLSRQELFRFSALEETDPVVAGPDESAGQLTRILALEPTAQPPEPGLTSTLRDYQHIGHRWLWWLWENRFGGLLCDDMGLGKTHQVMALMASVLRSEENGKPFLVVCPTTVVSHWAIKLGQHAPVMKAAVYYGKDRDLASVLEDAHVLITSYGVLLRDWEALAATPFSVVVFDEMQQIKSAATKTHAAANALDAGIRIGLSGTPIENAVTELKALMDVAVPGYLGSDREFDRNFGADAGADSRRRLRRLIYPFTLRRLKQSVLDELPEKIEDIRYCELTDYQVKLYRDAIDSRARGIVASLQDENGSIPYIHIFALLTLLKQICNHPALVEKKRPAEDAAVSGKWELFQELLTESLDSGQKVVVYSQFAEMVRIIADDLAEKEIGHVVLTGASRNRGRLIEAFNNDPECRVFVGSLKAGGTGIDLVAGSVVIHYDRWWNAAREDQATDRVHRIGQRRGVQVFKLGTLEEKISAIIEKKRKLMADIVREDDPGLLKSFDRQELLRFLE